jgi:hypothetical protein
MQNNIGEMIFQNQQNQLNCVFIYLLYSNHKTYYLHRDEENRENFCSGVMLFHRDTQLRESSNY